MPEVCLELTTPFTTADTIGPVLLRYDGQQLTVSFANHATLPHEVRFTNVRSFSWTGWDSAATGAQFDGVCEVTGSQFLKPFAEFSVSGAPFRHFKLGFNAEGKFLDVVATGMEHTHE